MAILQTGNSQAERLADELLKLKPDVTAKDRSDAVEKFGCTKATISNYLNGKVMDNDTAVNFILFFKDCISKREGLLN